MKEWVIDLYPRKGGQPTKVRLFAGNQAGAHRLAQQMYPEYRPGTIKSVK